MAPLQGDGAGPWGSRPPSRPNPGAGPRPTLAACHPDLVVAVLVRIMKHQPAAGGCPCPGAVPVPSGRWLVGRRAIGGGGGSPPKPVGEGSIPPTHPGIQPLVPSSLYPEATCLDVGARRDHPAWHGGLVARPCLWAWPSADKMTFFWPKCCFCGAILG